MKSQYIKNLPANWESIAAIFSALGDAKRQKILLMFERGEELSIKTIALVFAESRTTMVHHLTVLERSGILTARKSGREVLYRLCPQIVQNALEQVQQYIKGELL